MVSALSRFRTTLELMQLGLFSTTSVAVTQRLFSMANRGLASGAAAGIPKNPITKSLTGNEEVKLNLCEETEFPSLSSSFLSKPAGSKRKNLIPPTQQKTLQVDQAVSTHDTREFPNNRTPPRINPKLPETNLGRGKSKKGLKFDNGCSEGDVVTSASISQQYDTDLPPNFGKKKTPNCPPKYENTYHERGESKRGPMLMSPTKTNIDEPFDICFPGTRKSNHKRWVSKAQSAEVNGQVLRPGMVLFKHYISISEQVNIVSRCRELGCGSGGFYRPGYEDGAKLRLYMMCLGQDWDPQTSKYGKIRKHDNATPPVIPREFSSLVERVIDDSHALIKREDPEIENPEDVLPAMSPDVCIVNYYTTTGRLGLHKDRDESRSSLRKGLPVVSISIGDSAEFLYSDYRDVDEAENVLLESGDVLVFGGESRHVFHGVKTIIRDTAPRDLQKRAGLRPGRLNLTFRKY